MQSFDELYNKHFNPKEKKKPKDYTEYSKSNSLEEIKNKYSNNFSGNSKAYSREKSSVSKENSSNKYIDELLKKHKNEITNPYDDGSVWTQKTNRGYLTRHSDEEMRRQEHWSNITSTQRKNVDSVLEGFVRSNLKPNQSYVSQEYKDNYWENAVKTPLDSVRNQVDYYTNKLKEQGIEIPEPELDTNVFSKMSRTVFGILGMSGFLTNGVAGMVNEAVKIGDEKFNDKDIERELNRVKRELVTARRSGDTSKIAELEAQREELNTRWKDTYSDVGNVVEAVGNNMKDFTRALGAGVESAKNTLLAPFSDEAFKEQIGISDVVDTMKNVENNEVVRNIGNSKLVDNFVTKMGMEIIFASGLDVNSIGDTLKYLNKFDDIKHIDEITKGADSVSTAKQSIRQINRDNITTAVKASMPNESEEVINKVINDKLDELAEKGYKTLLYKTNKELGGVADDFKGLTIGNKTIIGKDTLEKIGHNKFATILADVGLVGLNPLAGINEFVKTKVAKGLKAGSGISQAVNDKFNISQMFAGGKTQSAKKSILQAFDRYKINPTNIEDIYKTVASKNKMDDIRHARQLQKQLVHDQTSELEKKGKKSGIVGDKIEEFTNKLEADDRPIEKEVATDVIGNEQRIAQNKEALKARDEIRNDINTIKGLKKDLELKKKIEEQKIDLNKMNEIKEFISSKLDGFIKTRETQIKKYETRIDNLNNPKEIKNSTVSSKNIPESIREMFLDDGYSNALDIMDELESKGVKFNSFKEAMDKVKVELETKGEFVPEANLDMYSSLLDNDYAKEVAELASKQPSFNKAINNKEARLSSLQSKIEQNKAIIEGLKNKDLSTLPRETFEKIKGLTKQGEDKTPFSSKIEGLKKATGSLNYANYKQDPKYIENMTNNLAIKDKIVKQAIERAKDAETLIEYSKEIDNIVDLYNKGIDEIQGKIDVYDKAMNQLKAKFNDTNDMIAYYNNASSGEFKGYDEKFLNLQNSISQIASRVDAFSNDSVEVKDIAKQIKESFKRMGIEEGIVEEVGDYYSYVFHMLNPIHENTDIAKQLGKNYDKYEFGELFNINAMDRKLKGSIAHINKVIENEYGVKNYFETNIFRIFAKRAMNNETFMNKKVLENVLGVNTIKYNVTKDIDNLVEAEDLAQRLGIEINFDELKRGLGEDVRFIDPSQKTDEYNWNSFIKDRMAEGKTIEEARKIARDSGMGEGYSPKTRQAEYKSYTGKKTRTIDRIVKEGVDNEIIDDILEVLDRKRDVFVGSNEKNPFGGFIKELKKVDEEIKRFRGMLPSKDGKLYMPTEEEAKEIAKKLGLSDSEWLPESMKDRIQYSPQEKLMQLNKQIKQKISEIKSGKDERFELLKENSGEDYVERVVKNDKVTKVSEGLRKENEEIQEQITSEMMADLSAKGLSNEEVILASSKTDFILELQGRLKEVNDQFRVLNTATDDVLSMAGDTHSVLKKGEIEEFVLVDRDMHNQYKEMIEQINGDNANKAVEVYKKALNTFKAWAVTSPGFHVTNIAGGLMNNYIQTGIDALSPKTMYETKKFINELNEVKYDVSKLSGEIYGVPKKDIAQQIIDGGLLSTFQSIENSNVEDFIKGTKASANESSSPLKKMLGAINPLDTNNNAMIRMSSNFGEKSEQLMKISNFMAHVKNGKELGIASDLATEAMFDYTDTTLFTDGLLKQMFPFITFMEKNIPFMFDTASKSTTKLRMFAKGKEILNEEASDKERALTPDYYKDGIRVGEGKYMMIDTPIDSFVNAFNPESYLGQLTPFLKAPIEVVMNRKMYNGQEISSDGDIKERLKYGAKTLLPFLNTYQRMGTMVVNENTENPLGKMIKGDYSKEDAKNWIFANKVKSFDMDKAEKQSMYEYLELLKRKYYGQ